MNGYVVTVDTARRVFTDGYVAFDKGRIVGAGRMADCIFEARERIDAKGGVVLPGIANCHNHLLQSCFRGYNDERWPVIDIAAAVQSLLVQLNAIDTRLDEERAYALTRLHALDLLKAGYTATHDEHFSNVRKDSADGSWAALRDSGMRGFLARCIVSDRVLSDGRETADAGLAECERLSAKFASDRIRVVPSFLNYQFVKEPADMQRIHAGAIAMGVPIDIDMTDNSRGAGLRARGFAGGQVEYYRSLGLLDRPLYAGKAVHIAPNEFAILARHDCRVGLVPMLRFFDGAGLPLHHLIAHDILPGIGTDAPMVTDNQSPFAVLRQILLAQNLWVQHEQDGPAHRHWATAELLIEMATIGGARTLFMDDVAGSIEVGKAADCVILRHDSLLLQPSFEGVRTLGTLIWAADMSVVESVFVAGRRLLADGRSTIWDEAEVICDAARVLRDLAEETGLMQLLPSRAAGQEFRGWSYA